MILDHTYLGPPKLMLAAMSRSEDSLDARLAWTSARALKKRDMLLAMKGCFPRYLTISMCNKDWRVLIWLCRTTVKEAGSDGFWEIHPPS